MVRSFSRGQEVKLCSQHLLFEAQSSRDGKDQWWGTCKPTPVPWKAMFLSLKAKTALSAVYLSGNWGRVRQKKRQVLGLLQHSRDARAANSAAIRTVYNNSGSSSVPISATEDQLCFSLSTFFKQCHRCCKWHLPHYSLPWRQAHSSPTHCTGVFFTLAPARGLTVTPLHFHINSTKVWWNQCGTRAGGDTSICPCYSDM